MTKLQPEPLDLYKYQQLLLYTAKQMENDSTSSTVRINKVLFYSDFASYRIQGKPITGAIYRMYHEGPAAEHMLQCIAEMEAEGILEPRIRSHVMGDFKYLKVPDGISPDLSVFNKSELTLVDEALAYMQGKTPREIVEMATKDYLWVDIHHFDDIPYSWAFDTPVLQDQPSDVATLKDAGKSHPMD